MDLLFRKGYPMPELRKLQVSTATTVSAKDIIILGCVGGTIKVFPIQTGQPTRAFATFLPCLHKLYFEKQGGNIISRDLQLGKLVPLKDGVMLGL